MSVLFHASPVGNIRTLEPRVSNHGLPRIYFSQKRENVLVYLSNAVEKTCRETGFVHDGVWQKWASYGFTSAGVIRLEEYWPDALREIYSGVSGWIYSAERSEAMRPLSDVPDALFSEEAVPVVGCEFVPDAYEAILEAHRAGSLELLRYEALPPKMLDWIRKTVAEEYRRAENHLDYRHFLREKFSLII